MLCAVSGLNETMFAQTAVNKQSKKQSPDHTVW
jgi:hypothetical protein